MQLLSSIKKCEACNGSGLRHPLIGETVYVNSYDGEMIGVIANEQNYRMYSLNCEFCAAERRDRHRAELQDVSELTTDERAYRLDGIVITGRPDTKAMVQACYEMVDQRASMLTFWGNSGNGKSVALIATVNEFLDKGVPGIYIPSYDMLNWIQDAINEKGEIKSETAYVRLERLKSVRVLAVDELQGFNNTGWRLEQLRNLIDRRWRDGLDGKSFTLFAMNEEPDRLEYRIHSRLKDGRNRRNGEPAIVENQDTDIRSLLRRKS